MAPLKDGIHFDYYSKNCRFLKGALDSICRRILFAAGKLTFMRGLNCVCRIGYRKSIDKCGDLAELPRVALYVWSWPNGIRKLGQILGKVFWPQTRRCLSRRCVHGYFGGANQGSSHGVTKRHHNYFRLNIQTMAGKNRMSWCVRWAHNHSLLRSAWEWPNRYEYFVSSFMQGIDRWRVHVVAMIKNKY